MARILLIDDDTVILESLEAPLSGSHEVHASADARAMLMGLHESTADVLVLDLRMPGLDGAAFLRGMEERGISIPVIVMTAGTIDDARLGGLRVAAVVRKPFDIEELERRIAQVTGGRGDDGKEAERSARAV